MFEGLLHFHRRKRRKLNQPVPHPDKWKGFMDRFIYVVGVLGPLMTLPQVIQIFNTKNASGVSIFSWIGYSIFSIFWLIYGFMHKEKPIIIAYIINIVLNILVVIGTAMYG